MVDDTIYGGGCGMLMKTAPLYAAVEAVRRQVPRRRIIFMGPAGQTFDQAKARELATYDQLILLCGHYEGVDYRVEQDLADETISVGDYVLTGGELPAMTVTDAVARMIPGVLGAAAGAADDYAKIDAWRREASLARTLELRPDLLQHCDLSPADQKILAKLKGAKKG